MRSNELKHFPLTWPWIIISGQVARLAFMHCCCVILFFLLENKPSQRSAEMLAGSQLSHCLVLGAHLLTCSTDTLQLLIKRKYQSFMFIKTLAKNAVTHIRMKHQWGTFGSQFILSSLASDVMDRHPYDCFTGWAIYSQNIFSLKYILFTGHPFDSTYC